MNKLREDIANELDTFRTVANSRSRGGDDPMDVAWEFVPRFMALIAEAMLSEEAIVTAVYAGMKHRPNAPSHYRATTAAQLAAAGITGAGQEGGEGE